MRLARVGIEDLAGYLDGGIEAWKQAGFELAQLPQMTVQELNARLHDRDRAGAGCSPAGRVGRRTHRQRGLVSAGPLQGCSAAARREATIAVHCKSGYRSMIACSLLQRAGYDVVNVIGGFDAWEQCAVAKRRRRRGGV